MLRRQLTGSFVCLRCRLQQGGPAGIAHRRPFALSARARNNESHATERQRILDAIAVVDHGAARPDKPSATPESREPSNDDVFKLDNAEPNDAERAEESPDDANEPENMIPIQKYVYERFRLKDGTVLLDSDNKTVRTRGQRFRVDGEHLPVDILGQPGAAIVMRAEGQLRKLIPEAMDPSEDPEPSSDIAETMEKELGAGDEDYLLNIHELRQTDRTLTEVEFNALRDTLTKGFTKAQLEAYLADSESFPRDPVQVEIPQVPDPKWVLSRRPWIPNATEGTGDGSDIMRGYISRSMTPKQRLVAEILRKSWGLSCDSVSGNMGRLDVTLRDVEFGLLLLGSQKWLRDITRNYLDTGSQIEIIVPSNTVSIRAPRTRSEVILQAINNVLAKAKTTALDADLISSESIDPGLLEDVGRITNSIVRPSGNQIVVTWINLPEPAQGLEDLADVVLRYLLSAFHSQPRATSAAKILPREQAVGGRYITNFACQSQLPWHERRQQWARWVVPSPVKAEEEAETNKHHSIIPVDFLPHTIEIKPSDDGAQAPIKMPVPFSGDKIPIAPRGSWSSDSITDTQAVFGQVLHAQPPHPPSPSATPTTSQSLDTSLPRSFVPTLPPLAALGFPTNIHEEGLWHSILVLQFLPSPSSPDAPALELRLEADHLEIKRIISLRAVTSSFIGDVLFPAAPVDLRLHQDRYFELPGDGIDVHAPAILKFLQAANLRPWAGKLATPPKLEGLMLPRRLLSLAPTSSSSPEVSGPAEQDTIQEPVEESDSAVTEVEHDSARGPVEETPSPVVEAEEHPGQEHREAAASPDATAEQDVAQESAQETIYPLSFCEQEAEQDTTPDNASTESTTSPESSAPQTTIAIEAPPPPPPAETPEPDLVPVSYRFAAIEVQRVVTANYEGFRLGYRSTEAGQRGGKRSELVLRAAAAPYEPQAGVRKPVVNAASFLRIASGLANKVADGGGGGGPSSKARSEAVFSWHGGKERWGGDEGYLYAR